MKGRGVHLQYSFETTEQRGAAVHNPLFDLLVALREKGSIRHAAIALGGSYRHVWGSLKHWEEVLGEPLVSWKQGQATRLTDFAERLLWAETRARTRLTPHIEALRSELERVLSDALDGSQHVLMLAASHDLALPLLRDLASRRFRLHMDLRFAGSLDALRALAEHRCVVAGFHVPPLATATPHFAKALKRSLEPGRHKLIGCLRRTQGLIVAAGNPLRIASLADLAKPGHRFVNRQQGSGTRLLMDHLLHEQGLNPDQIAGFDGAPEDSHVAIAAAVASGAADAGPGIEAAARQFGLDFVPLTVEDYFLVCLKESLDHPAVIKLCQALESEDWHRALGGLPGYQPVDNAGEVLSLTRALPWWHFRSGKNEATG